MQICALQAKKTPLHMAAQYGRISVCSTLLKMKADANATDVVRAMDMYRQTVKNRPILFRVTNADL